MILSFPVSLLKSGAVPTNIIPPEAKNAKNCQIDSSAKVIPIIATGNAKPQQNKVNN